jgi:hypothetical protein
VVFIVAVVAVPDSCPVAASFTCTSNASWDEHDDTAITTTTKLAISA